MELDLWLRGRLVARTESKDRGRAVRITYNDAVAAQYGAEMPLLSCALPTPGPSGPAQARAFLEGLLPEGRALDAAAAQVRGVRLVDGAPETAADTVALLAEYGRECAGAVVVVPAGDDEPTSGHYEALDQSALDAIVRDLPRRPIGTDLSRNIRMSLAGAQPKFLLTRIEEDWYEPSGGAASTHILKPTTAWPHSAQNEALIIALARACGLTDCAAWVEHIADTDVFVAERYDRRIEDGRVSRRHQEDMCQAAGIRPLDKYRIGRPSGRMTSLLRVNAERPRVEILRLFRQLAFRAIVGDEDGHGKNYSLLLDDGAVRLAPLYDSLCTLVYTDLTGTMGAPIGRRTTLATVDRAALLDEAQAMALTRSEAEESLDSLALSLRAGLDHLDKRLTAGWPSEQVTRIVLSRIERLQNNRELGTGSPVGRRGRGHLDAATRRRQSRSDTTGTQPSL